MEEPEEPENLEEAQIEAFRNPGVQKVEKLATY